MVRWNRRSADGWRVEAHGTSEFGFYRFGVLVPGHKPALFFYDRDDKGGLPAKKFPVKDFKDAKRKAEEHDSKMSKTAVAAELLKVARLITER